MLVKSDCSDIYRSYNGVPQTKDTTISTFTLVEPSLTTVRMVPVLSVADEEIPVAPGVAVEPLVMVMPTPPDNHDELYV